MTAGLDPFAELLALIERHGWAIRHVMGDANSGTAPFSYTVGLTALDHPELVTTGLPFEVSQIFLNSAALIVKEGAILTNGLVTDELTESGTVTFVTATDVSGLTAVEQVYGVEIHALQLVWPDSSNRYPLDAGYRNANSAQPLLGARPL